LSAPKDYHTELPFVDVFRLSRPWISQKKGAGWGKGPTLALDDHGWVTRLEPGCYAETLLCTIPGGHYPGGNYTVRYDGEGKLEFWGAAAVVSSRPGQMLIRVTPAKGGFFLRVTATDPRNHVRNIRVLMPGFADKYRDNPWHPAFLRRWQGVACIRFMDFMLTNNSTVSTWPERPRPEDATFSEKGVPLELMIDLANRLRADAWFCMPHRADDGYVRNFAAMVKERLDPKLKAYVEYSNEVWNGGFKQHRYAAEEGKKLGYSDLPWQAALRYTAHRSVQIFRTWEEEFGGTERLVRVLPSQAANLGVSQQLASFENAYKHADVLAIAPYVGFVPRPKARAVKGQPSAEEAAGWTVDQLLDYLESRALLESINYIYSNKKIADKFGLRLVAYEGGQHLVGTQGAENNEALTRLFHAANTSPRLGRIYRRFFEAWEKGGGDLFCHFNSVEMWSKWGNWGLLQFSDDDPAKSPKFLAVMRWAKSLGQPVNVSK
jgi:hypothetical protein